MHGCSSLVSHVQACSAWQIHGSGPLRHPLDCKIRYCCDISFWANYWFSMHGIFSRRTALPTQRPGSHFITQVTPAQRLKVRR